MTGITETSELLTQLGDRVNDTLENLANVSAERVFRDPVQAGERVVIVAAAISVSGGFGFGTGSDEKNLGGGAGGGGGAHSEGRPIAAIEITPDGVRVRPVLDFTRIGLTVLAAVLTVWRASHRRAR